jgi:hypothetical protein
MCVKFTVIRYFFRYMVGEPEALRPLGNMQRCKGHKLSLNLAFFFASLRLCERPYSVGLMSLNSSIF